MRMCSVYKNQWGGISLVAQWFKDPAVAQVQPLAWELPYAECEAKKKNNKKKLWRDSLTILRLKTFITKTFLIRCSECFTFHIKYPCIINQISTYQRRLSRPFSIMAVIISSKYLRGSSGHVTSIPHNRAWEK